jgi:hypothetical protein
MKSPARDVHLPWRGRLIQGGKLTIELVGLMRLNTRLAPFLKKQLKPFVAKRFDHAASVSLGDTRGNLGAPNQRNKCFPLGLLSWPKEPLGKS